MFKKVPHTKIIRKYFPDFDYTKCYVDRPGYVKYYGVFGMGDKKLPAKMITELRNNGVKEVIADEGWRTFNLILVQVDYDDDPNWERSF